MNKEKALHQTYRTLKITYGVVPIVAGLDKFVGLLADWSDYLSPAFAALIPFSPEGFMYAVGVIEIAAGVLVLSRFGRIGAWVVAAWLVAIAINLILAGFLDIAVRDLVMAVGAAMLARIHSAVDEPATQPNASAQPRTATT